MSDNIFGLYIGIPFLNGGRDAKKGLDCWGLFLLVQKDFGNDIPDFTIPANETSQINATVGIQTIGNDWIKSDNPSPGDAVLMAIDSNMPGMIQHFGTMISSNKFIHTLAKTGSIVSDIEHPFWSKKIRGYYRWNKK